MRYWTHISDFPLHQKLRLFNLLTSLIAGLFSALLLILIVWHVEIREAEYEAGIKAAIIAENALPALRFRDVKTAQEILAGLGRDSEIIGARIIEPDGSTFAAFVPDNKSTTDRSSLSDLTQIHVTAPMGSGGGRLATLELDSGNGYVIKLILTYVGAVLLSTLLALLVGYMIAMRLHRSITHPLLALVELMKNVSAGGNLSQRANCTSRDEVGVLSESFNRMIEQVEQRNTLLGNELAERHRVEGRLQHLALHDQVTGLPNRHFFRQRTTALMRGRLTVDRSMALLFIDLDNFKYVNDTFGHDCGDQLLIVVANRLSASVRSKDLVVRFGGDEFVVLMENVDDLAQAQRRSSELLKAITQPFKLADRDFFITCSIGVAMSSGVQEGFDEMLQKADSAMYVAKKAGKNGISLWQPSASNESRTRFELEADLHQALENGELSMHYQPIIDLASGRIAGMEALMRWRHPARGFVSPAEFIPIAEENGLIIQLGEWAMETAFSQAKKWNDDFGPLFMAVNVSGRQFRDPLFTAKAEAIAQISGLARDMSELEVTESILMVQGGEAARIIDSLSNRGFSMSLDDFGTGYSSLSYLKRFSLDKLKIDRSFVADLPDDVENLAITKAIIGLAHILSMRVVAEGIETPAQATMLRQLGCQYGQGFYFSKPLPAERMAVFITENQATTTLQMS